MSSDPPTFAEFGKGSTSMLDAASLEAILQQARDWPHSTAWAWYRAGEQLHLEGQGDPQRHWPLVLANHEQLRAAAVADRAGRGSTRLVDGAVAHFP